MPDDKANLDGGFDYSGGVDSGRTPMIQSEFNPNGLPRTSLAWLNNGTVRGGGIQGRGGWNKLCTVSPAAIYQSGFLYDPTGSAGNVTGLPYLMLSIGGQIFQVRVDTNNSVVNLTGNNIALFNPSTTVQGWMAQGEQFLIIQAGDFGIAAVPALPLFWDGVSLRRSNGTVGQAATIGTYTFTTSAPWVLPAVNATVVVHLVGNYGGAVGDVGQYSRPSTGVVVGTFQVTNIGANTVTLELIQSQFSPGITVSVGNDQIVVNSNVNTKVSELPAAGPMCYHMGRLWYAQGRTYIAGDIVDGPSGTFTYQFRDSILKVTENPLAIGGDGFTVPNSAGNITALFYPANLDTTLGQGPLMIGTRRQIYQLVVPVTRANWIASNQNNQPLQTVAQQKWGPVGDRGVCPVNGDNFYPTLEPGVRSFIFAQRQYFQWGNIPISRPEARVLNPKWQDRTLMATTPAVNFDNRLLIGALPYLTPVGVAFRAIMPLDFDIISSFGHEVQTADKPPPAWEGMWEGLDVLQLFEGDYNGVQRCFATVHNRTDNSIEVWENITSQRTDNGDNRIQFQAEFPSYDFGSPFDIDEIDGIQIWVDKIFGQIDIKAEFRTDADPCWRTWNETRFCAARSSAEDLNNPVTYPLAPYCEGFKFPITFGPPQTDACVPLNKRQVARGYIFQPRITILGQARIRAVMLRGIRLEQEAYTDLTVSCASDIIPPPPPAPPPPSPTPPPPPVPVPLWDTLVWGVPQDNSSGAGVSTTVNSVLKNIFDFSFHNSSIFQTRAELRNASYPSVAADGAQLTYTGTPLLSNLQLVVSGTISNNFGGQIIVSIDGTVVLNIGQGQIGNHLILNPGTYNFPFTLPSSTPGLVQIAYDFQMGPNINFTDARVVGTFTPG